MPFLNTTWLKNTGGAGVIAIDGVEETRRVEEVLSQIIFQAGVDYECVYSQCLNLSLTEPELFIMTVSDSILISIRAHP